MKPKNTRACKRLIKRYESITLEEIKMMRDTLHTNDMPLVAQELTGFGKKEACTLCLAIDGDCYKCVHKTGCTHDDTYIGILAAINPKQLLKAFRARAEYLKTLI